MEASIPAAKKLRTISNTNFEVSQCVREFKLQQQFPSMISVMKKPFLKSSCVPVIKSKCSMKRIKFITNKEIPLNKLQKLRIKSPNGKDLGEINVRLIPQARFINGHILQFDKQNDSIQLVKPRMSSTEQLKHKERKKSIVSQISQNVNLQAAKEIVSISSLSLNNALSNSSKQNNKDKNNKEISHDNQHKDTSKSTCFTSIQKEEEVRNKLLTNDNGRYASTQKNQIQILIGTNNNSSPIENNRNKLDNMNPAIPNKKVQSTSLMYDTENLTHKIPSKIACYKNVAESKYPLVKCERLIVPNVKKHKNNTLGNENTSEKKQEDQCLKLQHQKNMQLSLKSSDERFAVKNRSLLKKSLAQENETDKSFDGDARYTANDNEKNLSLMYENVSREKSDITTQSKKLGENVMVVLPENNTSLLNGKSSTVKDQNFSSKLVINKNFVNEPCSMSLDNLFKHSCTTSGVKNSNDIRNSDFSKDSVFQNNSSCVTNVCNQTESIGSASSHDTRNNVENHLLNETDKNSYLQNLSDNWNILTKAVSSVKDDELRTKALKALADCGIGLKRSVPILPPQNTRVVHDTIVQTDIFGLWDKENFILANKDLPIIQRIGVLKQNEYNTLNTLNSSENMSPQCNTLFNDYLALPSIDGSSGMLCNLDNFFTTLCNENEHAGKIKEVLTTSTNDKIYTQLQKDFNDVKRYDGNGMLNIHRAVLNNRKYDVQRHSMVLQACGESIDIPTEDEMTSLEMAIKYECSPQIIKILLEAGAQPVLMQAGHDSALIIAAKKSSLALPDLVKYVSNKTLLDHFDSVGFTALHYCARFGNLEGVRTLIRAGASVNLRDNKSGRTPLFHAIECNQIRVAQCLLDNGALASIVNFAGQTVLPFMDDVRNFPLRSLLTKTMK